MKLAESLMDIKSIGFQNTACSPEELAILNGFFTGGAVEKWALKINAESTDKQAFKSTLKVLV